MSRPAAVLLLGALLIAATVAVAGNYADQTRTVVGADGHRRTIGRGQIRFDGLGPEAWAARYRELRRRYAGRLELLAERPRFAIALMFGSYAGQAMQVASCETGGTFSTSARNGQHRGIFQMGSEERATYGSGSSALAQARAAYVYFVVSGRDWSPWSCKP